MNRVGNLKIIGCMGMLFIIAALPTPLRAASPAAPSAVKPAAQPVAQKSALPAATGAQPAGKVVSSPAAPSTAPAAKSATPAMPPAAAPQSAILQMQLVPLNGIYSIREGLVMQFIFTAKAKTKLCLDKDILSQMQLSVFRSGQGKLPLKPLVIKDNSHLFMEPMRVVWLESGQSLTVRANLKRFQFDGGASWVPGEYNADAIFNLCEQTPVEPVTEPGHEIPIKAARQGWFMIME